MSDSSPLFRFPGVNSGPYVCEPVACLQCGSTRSLSLQEAIKDVGKWIGWYCSNCGHFHLHKPLGSQNREFKCKDCEQVHLQKVRD